MVPNELDPLGISLLRNMRTLGTNHRSLDLALNSCSVLPLVSAHIHCLSIWLSPYRVTHVLLLLGLPCSPMAKTDFISPFLSPALPPSLPLHTRTHKHTWMHHTYTVYLCTCTHVYTCRYMHTHTYIHTHTHTHTHTSVFSAHYQLMKMVCLLNYLFVSIVALSFCLLVLLFFKILLFQISVKSPQGNSCMLQSHWLGTHTYTQRESQNLCKTPITRAQGQDLCCQPEQYHSVSTLHRAMQGTRTILWGGFDQLPRVSKAIIVVLHYQLSP